MAGVHICANLQMRKSWERTSEWYYHWLCLTDRILSGFFPNFLCVCFSPYPSKSPTRSIAPNSKDDQTEIWLPKKLPEPKTESTKTTDYKPLVHYKKRDTHSSLSLFWSFSFESLLSLAFFIISFRNRLFTMSTLQKKKNNIVSDL